MKHELKIEPQWFETVISGVKNFEVRKDDREPPFAARDELFLREYDGTRYTGRTATADVLLVLRGEYCKPGYCIMSLGNVVSSARPRTNYDRLRSMSVEELAEFLKAEMYNDLSQVVKSQRLFSGSSTGMR